MPFVARGSGTGLSGGALPHAEGVLVVTSRMREITEVRPRGPARRRRAGRDQPRRHPGGDAARLLLRAGPVSQQICSIGGNVAENSGGAHCLKYGFTTNHVLGADFVTPQGDLVRLGGDAPDSPGYDLLGAVVGSEGTLGIVTSVTVRLVAAARGGAHPPGRLRVDRRRPAPRCPRSSRPASCPPRSR